MLTNIVNGLAIVIFLAQLGHFNIPGPDGAAAWMTGGLLFTMIGLIALTMAIIYLCCPAWPRRCPLPRRASWPFPCW